MTANRISVDNPFFSSPLRKIIVWIFCFLFVFVPLFFSTKNDELFEFNKMVATYAIAVIIGGVWAIEIAQGTYPTRKKTPFDLPLALFVGSQLLSTLLSMHPHTSWFGYYSRFNGGFLSVITYAFLFYAFVHHVEKKDIAQCIRSILFGGLLVSLYAIPEHFGHSLSCLIISKTFTADCWVQDVQSRVFATFGQPNWLAAYVSALIFVGIGYLFVIWKRRNEAIVVGTTIIAMMLTLIFTQSRSGLGALIGGGCVFLILLLYRYFIEKKSFSFIKEYVLISIFFTLIFVVLLLAFGGSMFRSLQSAVFSRFAQTPQSLQTESSPSQPVAGTQLEVGGTESGVIRSIVWKGAIQVWKRYPLFGSGVETFAYSYYLDRPTEHNLVSEWDFLYNKAHNEFLNYLATTGTVGFLAYLCFIGSFVFVFLRNIRKYSDQSFFIAASWVSGSIALHISNFFGFSTVVVSTILFLVPAVVFVLLPTSSDESKRPIPHPYIGIGLGIVSIILLFQVLQYWRADALFSQAKRLTLMQYHQQAFPIFEQAIAIAPDESIYHEEYANALAQLSVAAFDANMATAASQLAQQAVEQSDISIRLNPVSVNTIKSRARLFITLAQIQPSVLTEAFRVLKIAQNMAPTDAKITYNIGLLAEQLEGTASAIPLFEKAIQMKPNYAAAKTQLELLQQRAASSSAKTK